MAGMRLEGAEDEKAGIEDVVSSRSVAPQAVAHTTIEDEQPSEGSQAPAIPRRPGVGMQTLASVRERNLERVPACRFLPTDLLALFELLCLSLDVGGAGTMRRYDRGERDGGGGGGGSS
jgi:hypothetical protein